MRIWTDGRSGVVGGIAGDLVLQDLSHSQGIEFVARKGTTFHAGNKLVVGRVCSNDSYLGGRDVHWANLSLEQHREVSAEAQRSGLELIYLFITALFNQPEIHYWTIPGDVVAKIAFAGRSDARFVYAFHIRERPEQAGHFFAEGKDVTVHHHVLHLDAEMVAKLNRGFASMKLLRETTRSRKGQETEVKVFRGKGISSSEKIENTPREHFQIPLKGGRSAVISLPLPAAESDLEKIKGWIDLMNDVLTEAPVVSSGEAAIAANSAGSVVAKMQRDSMNAGTDKMTEAEIEAEIKQARRERR